MSFEPHDVEWTPEKVRRFWDAYSANDALEDMYFAKAVGRDLIAHVSRRISIGTALDLGCGRGDLIGYLLERRPAYGVDQSPESVSTVDARFRGNGRFKGAFTHVPEAVANTVFVLEVVEHVDDAALDKLLSDARRALKPKGNLVVTTPNEENLELRRVSCPDCGCRFHRMQHVRSWSAASLSARMAAAGFRTISCAATSLTPRTGASGIVDRMKNRLLGRRQNLIFIGAARS